MSVSGFKLFTDGASRGNPGISGAGIVLMNDDGETICCEKKYLGIGTNNEAEYKALNLGLEEALKRKCRNLNIYMDSELIVRQLSGIYKIKNARLSGLSGETRRLLAFLDKYTITHVPRSENKTADRLANEAIDEHLTSRN